MMNKLIDILKSRYTLKSIDAGEFARMKVSGMTFDISAWHAEGLGHVSAMTASGFLGLMRMDTLIIVPEEKDLPLYSYDRILAMGNDTLIIELYDTVAGSWDGSAAGRVAGGLSDIPERDPGTHWYDSVRLPQSVSRKSKKKDTPRLDAAALDYLSAYLSSPAEDGFDPAEKRRKSEYYVSGLLTNGGPSTDVFKKKLGEEKTKELFERVLFGTAL